MFFLQLFLEWPTYPGELVFADSFVKSLRALTHIHEWWGMRECMLHPWVPCQVISGLVVSLSESNWKVEASWNCTKAQHLWTRSSASSWEIQGLVCGRSNGQPEMSGFEAETHRRGITLQQLKAVICVEGRAKASDGMALTIDKCFL